MRLYHVTQTIVEVVFSKNVAKQGQKRVRRRQWVTFAEDEAKARIACQATVAGASAQDGEWIVAPIGGDTNVFFMGEETGTVKTVATATKTLDKNP